MSDPDPGRALDQLVHLARCGERGAITAEVEQYARDLMDAATGGGCMLTRHLRRALALSTLMDRMEQRLQAIDREGRTDPPANSGG